MAKLDAAVIHAKLREQFGDAIGDLTGKGDDQSCTISGDKLVAACTLLKDDPAYRFNCLSNLSGVDYPKQTAIQIVYHLYSYVHRHYFVLKVNAHRDDPQVPTVSHLWSHAEWQEREAYDLVGVNFGGHPDMRRILMPEDWPGHPLRKDFVEPEEYHGIATSRESLLKV